MTMRAALRAASLFDVYWFRQGGTPNCSSATNTSPSSLVDARPAHDDLLAVDTESIRFVDFERESGMSRPLIESAPPTKYAARLSPDQRWLAYVANVTGTFELFVTNYPATRRQWQLTSFGGAREPLSSREGRALLPEQRRTATSIPISRYEPFVTGTPDVC